MVSSIVFEIQVKDRTTIAVRPRPGWAPYFVELLRGLAYVERETSLELAKDAIWKGKRILAQAALVNFPQDRRAPAPQ